MGELIVAPERKPLSGPLIFLGGPIQGSKPWQLDAINYIRRMSGRVNIACPRRQQVLFGSLTEQEYNEQVDWETHYLKIAGGTGAVLFWLAKEEDHDCKRAFAQTSRFELGEWKEKFRTGQCKNLVLGIEAGFTNNRYIRRRFGQDCPGIVIHSTLVETCLLAVELATRL